MSEMIDTGNPMTRDAQTFEHNAEDLKTIGELKDRIRNKLDCLTNRNNPAREEHTHEMNMFMDSINSRMARVDSEIKELRKIVMMEMEG